MTLKEKIVVFCLFFAVFGLAFAFLGKIDKEMMTECQKNYSFEYCQNHVLK